MGLHLQLVRPTALNGDLSLTCCSIKKQRAKKNCVLPDRTDVTMTVPFMNAYVQLLIQTCHK